MALGELALDLSGLSKDASCFSGGAGPSKAGGPSRKDSAPFPETRETSFFFMLSASGDKTLPEQKGPAQKAFPSHRPLQPHLSLIPCSPSDSLTHASSLLLLSSSSCAGRPLPTQYISFASIYPFPGKEPGADVEVRKMWVQILSLPLPSSDA